MGTLNTYNSLLLSPNGNIPKLSNRETKLIFSLFQDEEDYSLFPSAVTRRMKQRSTKESTKFPSNGS